MFKYPFSFDERIRRKEYGLSFLIVMLAQAIISAVSDSMQMEMIDLAVIPVIYFFVAQGETLPRQRCKRVVSIIAAFLFGINIYRWRARRKRIRP